jgi:hypothetical protein
MQVSIRIVDPPLRVDKMRRRIFAMLILRSFGDKMQLHSDPTSKSYIAWPPIIVDVLAPWINPHVDHVSKS